MPKLPMYERQTSVQYRKATPETFGASEAKAQGQMANTLSQIGDKIQNRNEVIDRVRMSTQFDQIAMQEFEAWQGADDVTDPESVKKYNDTMRTRMEEYISNHSGRADSKAQLRAQLESQFSNYSKNAISTQIKAQHTMLANFVEQTGNKLAIDAMDAPGEVDSIFAIADREIDKILPVLNTTEEDAYRNSVRQKVMNSTITGLLNKGQWETAKDLMQNDQYGKYLSTSQSQQAAVGIAKAQNKAIQDQKRIDRNVAVYSAAIGSNLTPEQVEKIKLMPDQDDMTLPDKIVQLELLTGEPATQDKINKLAGTYIKPVGGSGEGTMTERFMGRVNELTNRFALGQTTGTEDQEYLSTVNQLYGSKEVTDPITGMPRTVRVSMPLHVKEAMKRRGLQVESESAGGEPLTSEASAESGVQRTIWTRAENVAGPVPAIASKLQKTPLIGQEFGINPQVAIDRQFVDTSQRELVRSLSESERFSATEMKAIENEINIGPSVWDNPVAYQQRLIGIDEAITKRIENAAASLSSNAISGPERRKLMDSLNAMSKFKATLGVPIRVKTTKEAKELPPGTQFVDPNGRVWTRSENKE